MSDVENRRAETEEEPGDAAAAGLTDRARDKLASGMASAKSASERHVTLAVPFRAVERNRHVAASVLAGGLAYRLFLWLLPFGLITGGALGLLNAESTQSAVSQGGLPAAISDAIGDAARASQSNSWWLLAVGVPLLVWAGYTGAKAVQLVHSLIWNDPPQKTRPFAWSFAFTGVLLAVWAVVGLTWWVRGDWPATLAPVLTFAPLTGLWLWVSLQLPHRDASWKALLPGALLVSVGFEVLHALILAALMPKLEKSTSLYGSLGATTTVIFFMYLLTTLVVWASILNSTLHQELSRKAADG